MNPEISDISEAIRTCNSGHLEDINHQNVSHLVAAHVVDTRVGSTTQSMYIEDLNHDEPTEEVNEWIRSTSDNSFRDNNSTSYSNNDTSDMGPLQFPFTLSKFRPMTAGYKTVCFKPLKFYQFRDEKAHKFFVAIATLRSLVTSAGRCGYVSDLALEPLLISTILESSYEDLRNYYIKLTEALKLKEIKFTQCPYTNNIYVNKCNWRTLAKISTFTNDIGCDLRVSGGGVAKFTHEID